MARVWGIVNGGSGREPNFSCLRTVTPLFFWTRNRRANPPVRQTASSSLVMGCC